MVKSVRKREDAWNAIIAGFFVGGSLAIRSGPRHTFNSAVTCACVLAIFEGCGMMIQRYMAWANKPVAAPLPDAPQLAA
ncbi:unnamed protein product [[Candida] boidinii]|nr:unnamed protein product [[Candida] boidinii]